MCSETSPPRLSFSHDLGQADHVVLPVGHKQPRRDSSLLDLNCDFEFTISSSFKQESSSADELFSHGVILPMKLRDRDRVDAPKPRYNFEARNLASLPPLPTPSKNDQNPKKESTKESMDVMNSDHLEQKPQSKSFWGFKRSSSLNQDSKKSSLCSLQLLSRSNSTGSAPNPKKTIFKDAHKHNSQKQSSISLSKSSSCSSTSSSSSSLNPYAIFSRPPSRKGYGSSYGNGVRISPVLNVPSPYISKGTAKLFCLGSFLHPGKDKKAKK